MFQNLGPAEWIAIMICAVGVLGSAMGGLVGLVWWMSAMYSNVHATKEDVGGIRVDIRRMKRENKRDRKDIYTTLNEHGRQIAVLDERQTNTENQIIEIKGECK
jgi:hypothetical protein